MSVHVVYGEDPQLTHAAHDISFSIKELREDRHWDRRDTGGGSSAQRVAAVPEDAPVSRVFYVSIFSGPFMVDHVLSSCSSHFTCSLCIPSDGRPASKSPDLMSSPQPPSA